MKLVWKDCTGTMPDGDFAFSGDLCVGFIVQMRDDGKWRYYATQAVFMKRIAKGRGEVATRAKAKAAVQRAWDKWLLTAGLHNRGVLITRRETLIRTSPEMLASAVKRGNGPLPNQIGIGTKSLVGVTLDNVDHFTDDLLSADAKAAFKANAEPGKSYTIELGSLAAAAAQSAPQAPLALEQ